MDLSRDALDNLIFEIVRDLDDGDFSRNATRQNINDLVLDHVETHISAYALPAIQRLVGSTGSLATRIRST